MRFELRLQLGTERAALDIRRARRPIYLEHLVEMHQVDRHRAAIVALSRRLDATDDAGASTIRRRCDLRAVAPFEDADDVLLIARKRHDVDGIRIVAAKRADEIARTLPVAVPRAIMRRGRADILQRV